MDELISKLLNKQEKEAKELIQLTEQSLQKIENGQKVNEREMKKIFSKFAEASKTLKEVGLATGIKVLNI